MRTHHLLASSITACLIAAAIGPDHLGAAAIPSCDAYPLTECDAIEAAIDTLLKSADSVCSMLGEQASLRFKYPIRVQAHFEVGQDRFVRVTDSTRTSRSASPPPAVKGVSIVRLGPELPGRIAANEAFALNLSDSLSIKKRCP
jgi:hypothetical protein